MSTFGQGSINKLPCKMREHCPHADNALYCSHSQRLNSRRRQRPALVSAKFQKLVSSHSAGQQHSKSLRRSCSQFNAQAGSPSSLAVRASIADTSIGKTEDLGLAVTPSDDSSTSAPILSGAGGGIFFWWQLGVILCLPLHDGLLTVRKYKAKTVLCTFSYYCTERLMGCLSGNASHACPLLQVQ